MNYITVFSANAKEQNEALLASFKEFGGGQLGDCVTVICSLYNEPENLEFKAELLKYFDVVIMFPRSLQPYDTGTSAEDYSERVLSSHGMFIGSAVDVCYIPLGYTPNQKGWSQIIKDEYGKAGKLYMGDTELEVGSDLRYLSRAFVAPGRFFAENPCFRCFNKKQSAISRAINYTAYSLHSFKMPFNKPGETQLSADNTPVESDGRDFDVNAPKKVDSLPTKRPAKKAAKKKAARKKTVKKKAVRNLPKPLSADLIQ